MRCAYFHILIAIGYRLAYLVVHAGSREVSERSGKRYFTTDGKTCGNTYHVCLGNTALYKAVGEFFYKAIELKRTCKVGSKCYHVGVAAAFFQYAVTKACAGFFFVQYL